MTDPAGSKIRRRLAALDDARRKVLELRLRDALRGHGRPASGARLVAAVVGRQLDTAELRDYCERRLPAYMVPQVFAEMPELPRTPAGKTDRRALQRMSWSAEIPDSHDFVAPQTEVEARLAGIWGEVLGFDEISIHDNFFEVGGDSLLTIRILSRAAKEGLRIAPEMFFAHPTIAGQAALVEQQSAGAGAKAEVVTGRIPLLPIQEWFFRHIRTDPQHWNQSFLFRIDAALQTADIDAAIRQLINLHGAFRTRFTHTDGTWSAEILEQASSFETLRAVLENIDADESLAFMAERASAINQSFDLSAAPLLRAVHFTSASREEAYLLLVAHHLVIDAESWRFVLDDLDTLLSAGPETQGLGQRPAGSSPGAWAARLAELAGGEALAGDLGFWEARLAQGLPDLPQDFAGSTDRNREHTTVTASFSLDAAHTRALAQGVQSSLRATPHQVLLSALARAVAEWTQQPRVVFETEGHGREALIADIDVSRTVGWLTSVYPLVFEAPDMSVWEDAISALRQVKETVQRLPRNGSSFGLVRNRGKLRAFEGAPLLFNFLGQTDYAADESSRLELLDSSFGTPRSGRCERAFLIEINARIAKGELSCEISYSNAIHEPKTIQGLGTRLVSALEELLDVAQRPEPGALVASDFPLAELNPGDFDSVAAQLDALDDD